VASRLTLNRSDHSGYRHLKPLTRLSAGGYAADMTKTPGFRTRFRNDLRAWRNTVTGLRDLWDSARATQIFEESTPDTPAHFRKRTTDELPENSPRQLRHAALTLRIAAQQMIETSCALDDRAARLIAQRLR
jgi:hypothetical protein